MFLGMGPLELIIILVVVLVIFGPKNLPKLGKSLGKTVKGIREGMNDAQAASKDDDETSEAADVVIEDVAKDDDAPVAAASTDTAPAAGTAAEPAPAAPAFKFCPKCGTKNPPENHYCSKCGTRLDA